ncbi:MAG: acyltransferase [Verrucomicrobia bacterium]|nr:acyltransferase [Verrucomicrobiota bacterium]
MTAGPATVDAPEARGRSFNLDAVRAAAITMVVLAHLAVMSPVRRPAALTLSWIGQFGVDLFFVLSGWLIGGLFWREQVATGRVRWPRFFLRRALRTIPPYLAILPVAWFAVRWFAPARGAFDPGYLIFLQNYYAKMPYFSVSWSLCVEEHFYLCLPVLAILALRARLGTALLFAALVLVSPLCRTFLEATPSIDEFNGSVLATHLRLEGLVLGFWAAGLRVTAPGAWARVARTLPWLMVPSLAFVALSPLVPPRDFYAWGLTGLAASFLVVVGFAAGSRPWPVPAPAFVTRLAGMSYSIYLTHSLVIHVARAAALRLGAWAEPAYWVLGLPAIMATGYVFSAAIEKTTLRLRDRLLPAAA